MKKSLIVFTFVNLIIFDIHGMELPTEVMRSIVSYAMWKNDEQVGIDQKPKIKIKTIDTDMLFTLWATNKLLEKNARSHQNGVWHTLARNHALRRISKNFTPVFWHCFNLYNFPSQEKDDVIADMLRMWNQGNFHGTYLTFSPIPPIADIAINMGADLKPVLRNSIVTTRKCRPEFVRTIINAGKNDVINHIDSYGCTPLHDAIVYAGFSNDTTNEHFKIIQLLLSHPGTHVNPMEGQTKQICPLFWAVYHNHIEIVKLLLAHPDIQVNATDGWHFKETALFAAIRSHTSLTEFHSMIDLLITAGIDETIANKDGKTALDIAHSETYYAPRAEILKQALAMKNNG